MCLNCLFYTLCCYLPLQTVAEAHASLSIHTPVHAVRTKPGRWGHKNPSLPSLPLSSSCTVTSESTKPPPNDAPSSEDQPVDIYFSSSEEADSDSPFPDSSDSESETTSFQGHVRVSSKHKQPATENSDNCKPVPTQQDGVGSPIAGTSTEGKAEEDDSKTEIKTELPDGWTGAEVTYFRMLHPVFGYNYCTMAEMIRSKTCREVYEYGRTVSAELLQQHGDSVERQQLGGKKKKRNMR